MLGRLVLRAVEGPGGVRISVLVATGVVVRPVIFRTIAYKASSLRTTAYSVYVRMVILGKWILLGFISTCGACSVVLVFSILDGDIVTAVHCIRPPVSNQDPYQRSELLTFALLFYIRLERVRGARIRKEIPGLLARLLSSSLQCKLSRPIQLLENLLNLVHLLPRWNFRTLNVSIACTLTLENMSHQDRAKVAAKSAMRQGGPSACSP